MEKVTDNIGAFTVWNDLVLWSFNKTNPPLTLNGFETSFRFNPSNTFLNSLDKLLFFIGPTLPLFVFEVAEENLSTAFSKLAPLFNSISNLFAIRFAFWGLHCSLEINISKNSYSFSIYLGVEIRGIRPLNARLLIL